MKNEVFAKRAWILMLLVLSFAMLPGSALIAQTNTVKLGDVDGNGIIDIVDALLTARYYVGLIITLPNPQAADVDGNSQVTIVDALLIAQYYVGQIQSFPANTTPVPTPAPTLIPPLSQPTASKNVDFNTPFVIQYGETIAIPSIQLLLTLRDVSDSRCPTGAVCIWAGEAAIILDLWGSNSYLGYVELKAPPATPNSAGITDTKNYYHYLPRCISIDPYPVLNYVISKEQKTATIDVAVAIP